MTPGELIERKSLAEIAKIEAETAEIEDRVRRATASEKRAVARSVALAQKTQAELAKIRADATAAECTAREKIVLADKVERDNRETLTEARYFHVLNYTDGVSSASVKQAMDRLNQWDRLDPTCDIEIVFTSPGGDAIWGMALFDYIGVLRRKGHRVTTKTLGYAASMAGILLQAGDVRVMGAESWILIHEISAGTSGKVGEMEDMVDFLKAMCERVVTIFVDRSGGKLTREMIEKKWVRRDWWIDSAQALKLGLVDEVC